MTSINTERYISPTFIKLTLVDILQALKARDTHERLERALFAVE